MRPWLFALLAPVGALVSRTQTSEGDGVAVLAQAERRIVRHNVDLVAEACLQQDLWHRTQLQSELKGVCFEMCKTVGLYPNCPQCEGGAAAAGPPGQLPPPTASGDASSWDALLFHMDQMSQWARAQLRQWERSATSQLQLSEHGSCDELDVARREELQGKLSDLCQDMCRGHCKCKADGPPKSWALLMVQAAQSKEDDLSDVTPLRMRIVFRNARVQRRFFFRAAMSSWWPWRREEPQPQAEPESWLRLPWRGQSTPAARQPSGLSLQSLQTLSSGVLSSANEAEEALTSSDMLCPSLTIRQRVIGWLCCLGLGLLLEFSGFGRGIKAMAHGEAAAARFAALYSLGNVLALLGTFFLAGPMRQMRRMGREKRWAVSLCFLVSMVLTLT
ncbi:unnamed protein product, partial [Effrenium voratum]